MTENLNLLISVINSLRSKGLVQYAADLDRFLRKYTQQLGADPLADPLADMGGATSQAPAPAPAPQVPQIPPGEEGAVAPERVGPEKPNEQNTLQRTLFYQFEKWHDVVDRELPRFDYFGEENVAAIRSALAGVHGAMQQAFRTKPTQYDKGAALKWNQYVNHLVENMRESQKKRLNETKAIVDANLLYGTTNRMHEAAQRVFGDDPTFSRVLSEFGDLVRVFANVIKNTSEQVARRDLTEVR